MPPPSGSPAVWARRPRASCQPSARAVAGCPPTDMTTGSGSRPGHTESGGPGADGDTGDGGRRGRRRAAPGPGPPLPSAWSSLNIHFMVRAGRKRSQWRRGPWAGGRAGGRGLVPGSRACRCSVPVTTTTTTARQAGLPARQLPSNHPKRSASGRGLEGRGCSIWACSQLAGARQASSPPETFPGR